MYRAKNFEEWVPILLKLPVGQHIDLLSTGELLQMQASGEAVSRLRACFPGQIWKKIPPTSLAWWSYTTTLPDGKKLEIYADRVGPKSCRKIEETITETVRVPACEEHDEERTRTVVRWDCSGEEGGD